MDFDRNSMTVPVQSSDYTKKFLQKDSNPTTINQCRQVSEKQKQRFLSGTTIHEMHRLLGTAFQYAVE